MRYGTPHPEALVRRAAARGMEWLAPADRDNATGAVRFAKSCAAHGVRPIFGVDLAVASTRIGGGFEPVPGAPAEPRQPRDPAVRPRLRSEAGRQAVESLSGVPPSTVSGWETRLAAWSSVWSAPCGSIVAAQRSAQRARGFRAWRASCPSGVSS